MGARYICLNPPAEDESAELIHSYYDFVEQKAQQHCEDMTPRSIEQGRDKTLRSYEENDVFLIDSIIDQSLMDFINYSGNIIPLTEGSGPWFVRAENIDELISLFRGAVSRLESGDEEALSAYPYDPEKARCVFETGLIAICEFSLKNCYDVKIID
jgi:hypothetical protein